MELEKRIKRILKYSDNEWTVSDILQMVQDKKIFLLEKEGILVMVEVQVFPHKRVLHIWGAEGKGALRNMAVIVEWAKEIARALDCTELRCQGRKGWERALSKHGTRFLYTTLAMDV